MRTGPPVPKGQNHEDHLPGLVPVPKGQNHEDHQAGGQAPNGARSRCKFADYNLRRVAYLFHIVFTLQIICDFLNHLGSSPVPVPSGQRPERPEDNKKDQK